MYARFVRLFFLARYDIPFWLLRAQQNLVLCAKQLLCAKQPKSIGVQNTSVDKNNTQIDHGMDSEATPAYRLQVLPPYAGSKGIKARKIDASVGGRPSWGIVGDVDAALTPALPAT